MGLRNSQIHRFRDSIALAMPGQVQTCYLTPKEAAAIARALNAAIRDCKARPFVESQFTAVTVPVASAANG